MVLLQWFPRVPGLYWLDGSENLRQLSPEAEEFRSTHWVSYKPYGKSRKVMGGIGTLRLPPSIDNYRPQREDNLRTRLIEYTPAGMHAGNLFIN